MKQCLRSLSRSHSQLPTALHKVRPSDIVTDEKLNGKKSRRCVKEASCWSTAKMGRSREMPTKEGCIRQRSDPKSEVQTGQGRREDGTEKGTLEVY